MTDHCVTCEHHWDDHTRHQGCIVDDCDCAEFESEEEDDG